MAWAFDHGERLLWADSGLGSLAVRSDGICYSSSEVHVDPHVLAYLWHPGGIAASGGDIREQLFDPNAILS